MNRSTVKAVLAIAAGVVAVNLFFSLSRSDLAPDDLKSHMARTPGVVIDVRTHAEHEAGHLAITDRQIDFLSDDFRDRIADLDKDATYYLYCRSGNRSGQAARLMRNAGFDKVYNIGGFNDLVRAGFEAAP